MIGFSDTLTSRVKGNKGSDAYYRQTPDIGVGKFLIFAAGGGGGGGDAGREGKVQNIEGGQGGGKLFRWL